MQIFEYRIVGRTPGIIETTEYAGQVSAHNAKEAIHAALVAEFGNPDSAKPIINQLCDDGWIDEQTVTDHFASLADDAASLYLDCGDHTFDIEVRLSIGAT